MIVILGGTGAYFLERERLLGPGREHAITTPYGAAEPFFIPDRWQGSIALASRHGWGRLQKTPPYVNSRALIWAAQSIGAQAIISWNGVGAINPLLEVHDQLVLGAVLDGTKSRPRSFEGAMAAPSPAQPQRLFDAQLSARLLRQARAGRERVFGNATYACSEGPRLETAAEIAAWARFGADVVGMTLVPEVWLARELGIPFASLAYVTNYATGVAPSPGTARFFGVEVAETCLMSVIGAAEALLEAA